MTDVKDNECGRLVFQKPGVQDVETMPSFPIMYGEVVRIGSKDTDDIRIKTGADRKSYAVLNIAQDTGFVQISNPDGGESTLNDQPLIKTKYLIPGDVLEIKGKVFIYKSELFSDEDIVALNAMNTGNIRRVPKNRCSAPSHATFTKVDKNKEELQLQEAPVIVREGFTFQADYVTNITPSRTNHQGVSRLGLRKMSWEVPKTVNSTLEKKKRNLLRRRSMDLALRAYASPLISRRSSVLNLLSRPGSDLISWNTPPLAQTPIQTPTKKNSSLRNSAILRSAMRTHQKNLAHDRYSDINESPILGSPGSEFISRGSKESSTTKQVQVHTTSAPILANSSSKFEENFHTSIEEYDDDDDIILTTPALKEVLKMGTGRGNFSGRTLRMLHMSSRDNIEETADHQSASKNSKSKMCHELMPDSKEYLRTGKMRRRRRSLGTPYSTAESSHRRRSIASTDPKVILQGDAIRRPFKMSPIKSKTNSKHSLEEKSTVQEQNLSLDRSPNRMAKSRKSRRLTANTNLKQGEIMSDENQLSTSTKSRKLDSERSLDDNTRDNEYTTVSGQDKLIYKRKSIRSLATQDAINLDENVQEDQTIKFDKSVDNVKRGNIPSNKKSSFNISKSRKSTRNTRSYSLTDSFFSEIVSGDNHSESLFRRSMLSRKHSLNEPRDAYGIEIGGTLKQGSSFSKRKSTTAKVSLGRSTRSSIALEANNVEAISEKQSLKYDTSSNEMASFNISKSRKSQRYSESGNLKDHSYSNEVLPDEDRSEVSLQHRKLDFENSLDRSSETSKIFKSSLIRSTRSSTAQESININEDSREKLTLESDQPSANIKKIKSRKSTRGYNRSHSLEYCNNSSESTPDDSQLESILGSSRLDLEHSLHEVSGHKTGGILVQQRLSSERKPTTAKASLGKSSRLSLAHDPINLVGDIREEQTLEYDKSYADIEKGNVSSNKVPSFNLSKSRKSKRYITPDSFIGCSYWSDAVPDNTRSESLHGSSELDIENYTGISSGAYENESAGMSEQSELFSNKKSLPTKRSFISPNSMSGDSFNKLKNTNKMTPVNVSKSRKSARLTSEILIDQSDVNENMTNENKLEASIESRKSYFQSSLDETSGQDENENVSKLDQSMSSVPTASTFKATKPFIMEDPVKVASQSEYFDSDNRSNNDKFADNFGQDMINILNKTSISSPTIISIDDSDVNITNLSETNVSLHKPSEKRSLNLLESHVTIEDRAINSHSFSGEIHSKVKVAVRRRSVRLQKSAIDNTVDVTAADDDVLVLNGSRGQHWEDRESLTKMLTSTAQKGRRNTDMIFRQPMLTPIQCSSKRGSRTMFDSKKNMTTQNSEKFVESSLINESNVKTERSADSEKSVSKKLLSPKSLQELKKISYEAIHGRYSTSSGSPVLQRLSKSNRSGKSSLKSSETNSESLADSFVPEYEDVTVDEEEQGFSDGDNGVEDHAENDLEVSGVEKMQASPDSHSANVSGLKHFFARRVSAITPKVHGVKSLFTNKSPLNDLTNVEGAHELLKVHTSLNDMTNAKGVKQLIDVNSPVSDLTEVDDVQHIRKRQNTPRNDLRAVEGITETKKSPKNDLFNDTGVKRIYEANSPQNNLSDIKGVRLLFKRQSTPKNDLRNVKGTRKVFKRQNTPKNDLRDVEGVKRLMRKTSPRNDLSNVAGVKRMFDANSPKNDLSNVDDLKCLFRRQNTPKNDLTDVEGVRNVFKRQNTPKNDLRSVRGVKRLMKRNSPQNDLSNVAGVKRMFDANAPKNDLSDVEGVERLFKRQNTPKDDLRDVGGIKRLMKKTSPRNSLSNVAGVKRMFDANTPKNDLSNVDDLKCLFKRQNTPKNDLTDVEGVRNVFKRQNTPKNDLRNVQGVKRLMKRNSPQNDLSNVIGVKHIFAANIPMDDLSDVEGVGRLFKRQNTPKDDLRNVEGIRNIFKRQNMSKNDLANIEGVKTIMQPSTPKNDLTDVRSIKNLYAMEKVQDTPILKNTQMFKTPTEHLNVSEVKAIVEQNEEEELVPKGVPSQDAFDSLVGRQSYKTYSTKLNIDSPEGKPKVINDSITEAFESMKKKRKISRSLRNGVKDAAEKSLLESLDLFQVKTFEHDSPVRTPNIQHTSTPILRTSARKKRNLIVGTPDFKIPVGGENDNQSTNGEEKSSKKRAQSQRGISKMFDDSEENEMYPNTDSLFDKHSKLRRNVEEIKDTEEAMNQLEDETADMQIEKSTRPRRGASKIEDKMQDGIKGQTTLRRNRRYVRSDVEKQEDENKISKDSQIESKAQLQKGGSIVDENVRDTQLKRSRRNLKSKEIEQKPERGNEDQLEELKSKEPEAKPHHVRNTTKVGNKEQGKSKEQSNPKRNRRNLRSRQVEEENDDGKLEETKITEMEEKLQPRRVAVKPDEKEKTKDEPTPRRNRRNLRSKEAADHENDGVSQDRLEESKPMETDEETHSQRRADEPNKKGKTKGQLTPRKNRTNLRLKNMEEGNGGKGDKPEESESKQKEEKIDSPRVILIVDENLQEKAQGQSAQRTRRNLRLKEKQEENDRGNKGKAEESKDKVRDKTQPQKVATKFDESKEQPTSTRNRRQLTSKEVKEEHNSGSENKSEGSKSEHIGEKVQSQKAVTKTDGNKKTKPTSRKNARNLKRKEAESESESGDKDKPEESKHNITKQKKQSPNNEEEVNENQQGIEQPTTKKGKRNPRPEEEEAEEKAQKEDKTKKPSAPRKNRRNLRSEEVKELENRRENEKLKESNSNQVEGRTRLRRGVVKIDEKEQDNVKNEPSTPKRNVRTLKLVEEKQHEHEGENKITEKQLTPKRSRRNLKLVPVNIDEIKDEQEQTIEPVQKSSRKGKKNVKSNEEESKENTAHSHGETKKDMKNKEDLKPLEENVQDLVVHQDTRSRRGARRNQNTEEKDLKKNMGKDDANIKKEVEVTQKTRTRRGGKKDHNAEEIKTEDVPQENVQQPVIEQQKPSRGAKKVEKRVQKEIERPTAKRSKRNIKEEDEIGSVDEESNSNNSAQSGGRSFSKRKCTKNEESVKKEQETKRTRRNVKCVENMVEDVKGVARETRTRRTARK